LIVMVYALMWLEDAFFHRQDPLRRLFSEHISVSLRVTQQ
jgi:hypothetical protein